MTLPKESLVTLEHEAFLPRRCLQSCFIKDTGFSKRNAMSLECLKTFHFKLIAGFPVGTESSKYTLETTLMMLSLKYIMSGRHNIFWRAEI